MAAPEEFVSAPIQPLAGPRDTSAMARGEPGLPPGFTWNNSAYTVVERRGQWKESTPEGGKAGNEVYLRRHCYELAMSDGSTWVVYFTRQTPRGRRPTTRWFLFTRRAPSDSSTDR